MAVQTPRARCPAVRASTGASALNQCVGKQEPWAAKRECQNRDLAALMAGRLTEAQTSWFSGARARACRLVRSDF